MAKLIILIGLPGSGKSTLAQHLVGENPALKLISTDAIRAKLFGSEEVQGPWMVVWREIERQFLQAVVQINLGQLTAAIYDATNSARKQRRRVIQLARFTGFNDITGLWVDTPVQTCLERNRMRSRQVPEDIIWHMYRQLTDVAPSVEEGFERIIRLF